MPWGGKNPSSPGGAQKAPENAAFAEFLEAEATAGMGEDEGRRGRAGQEAELWE